MHFQQLPQNVVDTVFDDIKLSDGMQAIARLRLVSKAWLAAIQQYPGSAKLLSGLDKLEALQRIMPNVSKLCITHRSKGSTTLDLTPLAQYSQLTSLDLSAVLSRSLSKYHGKYVSLNNIPGTLRELEVRVRNLCLDASSFNSGAALLTNLTYQRTKTTRDRDEDEENEEVEWEWLQHLPHLKVCFCAPCCKSPQ